jgi:fatty acid desaturase
MFLSSTIAALDGRLPMWVACFINGFSLYVLFSPMHESLHGTVSSSRFVNEIVGRVALAFQIPAAPLEVARWVHLSHHANTTSENDPDNFMHHGAWWVLPFRWANFDVFYLIKFFKDDTTATKRIRPAVYVYVSIFLAVVLGFIMSGLALELLVLWFLPSRIGLAMIGFIFVFLPHFPADISARQNKYQATTTRLGWEWLLTPLMVYQNYHLIHHLYPNVPFYNYIKIWHLRYEEISKHNPAIQKNFGLRPAGR